MIWRQLTEESSSPWAKLCLLNHDSQCIHQRTKLAFFWMVKISGWWNSKTKKFSSTREFLGRGPWTKLYILTWQNTIYGPAANTNSYSYFYIRFRWCLSCGSFWIYILGIGFIFSYFHNNCGILWWSFECLRRWKRYRSVNLIGTCYNISPI